mmetsp:Transcript_3503/g.8930  ORF Transcript_3503/g.8930 Transcript_3503/m.8930 type:complete len:284 (-) Transcript_3503:249-1100(-)|eukprot:CAMPEP_0181088274 /NCGR_PEP_ID=MMETSP1071-20121207/6698_1 /TAXON_ID=35127 /ORGANISM="Thalassiosira sp., Strain NH16" /LENGTH=283 /DNA_ID=CAMNT_0023170177 /DNA_START=86 /DNA_END=937 /DNA_ORIENTATION=+
MVHGMALAHILMLVSLSVATAFIADTALALMNSCHSRANSCLLTRSRSIGCAYASSPSDGDRKIDIPSVVVSPVLYQVYPALVAHKDTYGNPNIPLGSTDGKKCKTLRRLHFQNKLTESEGTLLTEMGFIFHSFEDVYYECDFDEMLGKLLEYKKEFDTYQIPKKYELDPELGAWVTMLRRLHRTNDVPQVQVDKLDEVGFEWVSTRKCGSSFMKRYREVLSYLTKVVEAGGDVFELLHEDTDIMKWIEVQRLAHENGNLPESRIEYMDDLPGIDWRNPSSWA